MPKSCRKIIIIMEWPRARRAWFAKFILVFHGRISISVSFYSLQLTAKSFHRSSFNCLFVISISHRLAYLFRLPCSFTMLDIWSSSYLCVCASVANRCPMCSIFRLMDGAMNIPKLRRWDERIFVVAGIMAPTDVNHMPQSRRRICEDE